MSDRKYTVGEKIWHAKVYNRRRIRGSQRCDSKREACETAMCLWSLLDDCDQRGADVYAEELEITAIDPGTGAIERTEITGERVELLRAI